MSQPVYIAMAMLSTILLAGCTVVKPLEVSGVEGLEDIRIGRDGLEGTCTVVFNNPNAFAIQAKGADVDVFLCRRLKPSLKAKEENCSWRSRRSLGHCCKSLKPT
jgi:hypothetical protein